MYIIGLTGGIASGKSTVSKMLLELGACIVDTDKIAHDIMLPGKPAFAETIQKFVTEFLTDGRINREKLGRLVFSSAKYKAMLEEITHPYIRQEAERQLAAAKAQEYDVAVLDAPLLFEVKWEAMADEVWVVYVQPEIQLRRLMERDAYSEEEAKARISAQINLEYKAGLAKVIIENSNDIDKTAEQVLQAWLRIGRQIKK